MKEADADWKATNNWTKWVYEGQLSGQAVGILAEALL